MAVSKNLYFMKSSRYFGLELCSKVMVIILINHINFLIFDYVRMYTTLVPRKVPSGAQNCEKKINAKNDHPQF